MTAWMMKGKYRKQLRASLLLKTAVLFGLGSIFTLTEEQRMALNGLIYCYWNVQSLPRLFIYSFIFSNGPHPKYPKFFLTSSFEKMYHLACQVITHKIIKHTDNSIFNPKKRMSGLYA